jgi:4-amino-4-deoxy-L-arabinose transferase-like glycosyltransferase
VTEPALPALSAQRSTFGVTRRWLPLIAGLAVGMRLMLAIAHPYLFPDSADYDALGRALIAGRPYEVGGNLATRMPGYPLLVAAVYALAGPSVGAVLIFQALLAVPLVLLTYLLGKRDRAATGLLAAALVTLDPLLIGFSAALLSEVPFTVCLLLGLWMGVKLLDRPRWALWIGLGITWGIAVLLRGSALWCIVPVAGWIGLVSARGEALPRAHHVQRIAGPLVAIALTFAPLAPWLVRNYAHFHSGPMRLTTLEGISLYEAVYPGADGGPKQDKIALPPEMLPLDEARRNDEWSRRAWAHIRSDPLRVAWLGVMKFGRTWSPWFNAAEMQSTALWWGMTLWYLPLYALAMLGIVAGRLGRREKVLLLIPVAYFSLIHALFLGSVRYRVPLMPTVCIFAALGILTLARWRVNLGGVRKRSAEPGV